MRGWGQRVWFNRLGLISVSRVRFLCFGGMLVRLGRFGSVQLLGVGGSIRLVRCNSLGGVKWALSGSIGLARQFPGGVFYSMSLLEHNS